MQPGSRLPFDRVNQVLLAAWQREEEAGFPRLSPLPSTAVRKFLSYWERLGDAQRPILREALASRGTMAFGVEPGALQGDAARAFQDWATRGLLGQLGDEMTIFSMSLRLAKNFVSAARTDPMAAEAIKTWDPAIVERIAATESAKAPALRKAIGPLLRERFGLEAGKHLGADWTYERADGLRVHVDYGGRSQLRYWLRAPGLVTGFAANLEGTFGLPADWDWIAEPQTAPAARLLADGVGYVLDLGHEIAGLVAGDRT